MDFVDRETRRRIMSSVSTRDSGPELRLRKALYRKGYRYRLHVRKLAGSPDIVFGRAKVAVFVHGCFWHRHEGCKLATTPSSNTSFWAAKFAANTERDRRAIRLLSDEGWTCIVAWQCEIKNNLDHTLASVEQALKRQNF